MVRGARCLHASRCVLLYHRVCVCAAAGSCCTACACARCGAIVPLATLRMRLNSPDRDRLAGCRGLASCLTWMLELASSAMDVNTLPLITSREPARAHAPRLLPPALMQAAVPRPAPGLQHRAFAAPCGAVRVRACMRVRWGLGWDGAAKGSSRCLRSGPRPLLSCQRQLKYVREGK